LYLRALEIQGFKSFPDKTVLNFGEDITAIVGPNGSGKSNISDAIRWVMGEQSVKGLRGAKMEDVIFGGTEKRSQVGFAQVTLVLDNTEHIFPTMEERLMTHSSQWHSSQKIRMRLPSPSCLKMSATVWKSSTLGICSSSRSMDCPWSWGSFFSSIGRPSFWFCILPHPAPFWKSENMPPRIGPIGRSFCPIGRFSPSPVDLGGRPVYDKTID